MTYKTPEERAAYARAWRAKNPEKVQEAERKKREKAKEKAPGAATERMRKWREANPEKAKLQAERYNERLQKDPVRKEKQRQSYKKWMADPDVRARRKEQWKEWAQKKREEFPEMNRERALKSTYGLTLEQYDAMVLAQNDRCAICGTDSPGNKSHANWHIDHCHDTNKVRSLLCHGCNTGLGAFKDSPERLELAAAYLRRHTKALTTP